MHSIEKDSATIMFSLHVIVCLFVSPLCENGVTLFCVCELWWCGSGPTWWFDT